jgi:hypothetical protein
MLKFHNLISPFAALKTKIDNKLQDVRLRYVAYILGSIMAALLAISVAAGIVALFVFLPALLPLAIGIGGATLGTLVATILMAPLGAIFFALTFAFFYSINQIPALRRANHYLASGINNAANNGETIASTTSSSLAIGVSFLPGGQLLHVILHGLKYGGVLIATAVGFVLGMKERQEKYDENSRYQQYRQDEITKRSQQQLKVQAAQTNLLNSAKHPYKRAIIQGYVQRWEKAKQQNFNLSPGIAAQGAAEEKAATTKGQWLDNLSDYFNITKNYVRNLKLGYKIAFGLIAIPVFILAALKLAGLIVISPVVIPTILGVAAMAAPFIGIVFATMNYYRDKVEDKVFADNKAINKEMLDEKVKLHILYEEELLYKQLAEVNAGQTVIQNKPLRPTNFRRKYKNPLDKQKYGKKTMYAISTFAGWLTLGFAILAIASTIVAFKFTVLTGGLGLPVLMLSLGVSVLFTGLAVGNLIRRYYKEHKQQASCEEEIAKYERLQHELAEYKEIEPAVRLRLNAKNERSHTAIENYATYKGAAAAKKMGKMDFSVHDMLHAWHIPNMVTGGISLMNVTIHPILIIPVLLALPLMYLSYRFEKIRMKRDTQLDKLKAVNKHMAIELQQRKAAKTRMELVAEAQIKLADSSQELVNNFSSQPGLSLLATLDGQRKSSSPDAKNEPGQVPSGDSHPAVGKPMPGKFVQQQSFWQQPKAAMEKIVLVPKVQPGFFKPATQIKCRQQPMLEQFDVPCTASPAA